MAELPHEAAALWAEFLATSDGAGAADRFHEVFRIGATEEDADEGAQLILEGVKTATSSLLWEYEASGEPPP